jgi:ABC-type uncharacterized transport system auxiliary subunit
MQDPIFFRLDSAAEIPDVRAAQASQAILEVEPFQATGITGDRAMLYSADGGATLHQRHYASWAEAPARMIRDQFIAELDAAHLFSKTVPSEMRADAAYRLRGTLRQLVQLTDSSGKQGKGTLLILDITVQHNPDDRIVWSGTLRKEVAPKGPGIEDAAEALRTAVKETVADLIRMLAAQPLA